MKSITKAQAKIETELINNMIKDIENKDGLYNTEEIVKWLKLWKPFNINL